jgi:L-lactate dehydrogenase (cytochrome)
VFVASFTCSEDARAAARRRTPRFLFEYVDGGALDEATLRANVRDFGQLALRQQVLTGVGDVDTRVRLFGEVWAMPLALAPVGLAGMLSRRGEAAAARAAAAFGAPFTLSTVSVCTVEEVTAGAEEPIWFQLYMLRDRGFIRAMLARARAAGVRRLVFTVDMPIPGIRRRDERAGLTGGGAVARRLRQMGQALQCPAWCWDVGVRGRPHGLGHVFDAADGPKGPEAYWEWMARNFDPTVTWRDVEAVRAIWDGDLIVKGVMTPEDAAQAIDVGADGIVVSNHGGRQLDGTPSTISVLPRIVEEVGGQCVILVDGGVRSGLDVLRARALGADAVLIGRPWAWALAAGGGRGVARMLDIFRRELRLAMALTGCDHAGRIDCSVLEASRAS